MQEKQNQYIFPGHLYGAKTNINQNDVTIILSWRNVGVDEKIKKDDYSSVYTLPFDPS